MRVRSKRMRIATSVSGLVVAFAVTALIGCGGGGAGPVAPGEASGPKASAGGGAAAPKETAERRVEEKAEETQEPEYSYNPIGKRDPFRSFTSIEVVRSDIVVSELQNWELDQLRLVGVLWGGDSPVAMVEDPKGKGHIVHHGDLIGKKWGKVTQIKNDEVIVTEEFRDPVENRPITNEYSMQLPDPYEEK